MIRIFEDIKIVFPGITAAEKMISNFEKLHKTPLTWSNHPGRVIVSFLHFPCSRCIPDVFITSHNGPVLCQLAAGRVSPSLFFLSLGGVIGIKAALCGRVNVKRGVTFTALVPDPAGGPASSGSVGKEPSREN